MDLPEFVKHPSEQISLISGKNGNERVPFTSGLNWGQRPGRNQDQAYLAIPADVQRSGYFPKEGAKFFIRTDDGELWVCARRQANGKAIHTIDDNSILGRYFRKRLGLEYGDLITIEHLRRYGRFSIDIYKESEFQFILDFNVYDVN